MKYVVVYDKENDYDLTFCSCDSWKKIKNSEEHEPHKHDIRFIRPTSFINHNAGMGMSGTIAPGSDIWEIYIHDTSVLFEFNDRKQGASKFFEMLIDEAYSGDKHYFLIDFFHYYAGQEMSIDSNITLLLYMLELMGK